MPCYYTTLQGIKIFQIVNNPPSYPQKSYQKNQDINKHFLTIKVLSINQFLQNNAVSYTYESLSLTLHKCIL